MNGRVSNLIKRAAQAIAPEKSGSLARQMRKDYVAMPSPEARAAMRGDCAFVATPRGTVNTPRKQGAPEDLQMWQPEYDDEVYEGIAEGAEAKADPVRTVEDQAIVSRMKEAIETIPDKPKPVLLVGCDGDEEPDAEAVTEAIERERDDLEDR